MYTLHIANKNYSSWSLRPWALMKELSIPFKEDISSFKEGSNWNEFRAFSPSGLVPCLIDNGQIIWDSLGITEYLAEKHTEIWPDKTDARAWASLLELHPDWVDRVEVIEIDVSSDESVAKAAADVHSRFDGDTPLYAVVNSAGVGAAVGDIEYVLQVNARGVHRVCEAFLPLIDAQNGRIVNVTSASGSNFVSGCSKKQKSLFLNADIEWPSLDRFMNDCVATNGEDAFAAKGLASGESYGLSKACANSYTLMVARQHSNLRINACTPGFIETDMTRQLSAAQGVAPTEMGMRPPEQGTRSTLHLLFGELEGDGHYYGNDAVRSPMHCSRASGDPLYTDKYC